MKATKSILIRTLSVLLFGLIAKTAQSQDTSAGINVDNPNPNAVLHLVSPGNNQGLLIPTLTTNQRTTGMTLGPADDGLLVYDTDLKTFFIWTDGTGWVQVANTDQTVLSNILASNSDANGNSITNLSDPVNPQDVATKNYVDNQADSDNQDLSNVLLNGNSAGGNNITDVLDPTNPLDVANKNYVDTQDHTDDQSLSDVLVFGNDAGGFQINNVADPVLAQDVATKNYVDTQGDSDNQDLASVLGFGTSAANSIIADVADPLSPQDVATRNYVDSQIHSDNQDLNNVLNVSNDAGGFDIINVADPTNPQDVATKNYVDAQLGVVPVDAVTSAEIANGSIVDADVNAAAAIAGAKIDPDFGAQDITTTGNITVLGTVDGQDISTDAAEQTALNNLTGLPAGTTDLGTFTGTTITDNITIKPALQELETAIEGVGTPAASSVTNVAAGNIAATDVQGAINELDAEKLALAGGTMSGNLDMGANNLSNAGTITGTTLTDGTLSITTGNLTTTGTVDGRDVGTDGTNQDDIQTLTGLAAGTTDLGTFTGTTITDNISIKPALQELETAIEGVGTPAASSVTNVAAGNIAATDVQGAINELDAEKLALAGGTMSGNLDMGANNLSNAGTITGTTLTDGTLSITTGNLTTTGTVDGRDVGTDGTNQDDIQTLTGLAAGTTDLGTFTGTTITDNISIKPALQELETAIEGVGTPAASSVTNVAAGNIAATDVQGAINELDAEKLALAGGTMSGNLDMGANNLSNAGTITGTTLTDGTLSITTGNLTTTGTVDGRDVGTDGTNQDDIQTLTGLAAGTTDLGTFTGTTITDNISIKPALQELETAIESTTDDQTAAEVANTAAGNIAATDIQGAINELDAEKLALAGGTMSGNLDMGANNLSNAGTITGTTLTDGTLSITTGNLTTTGTVDGRDVGTDGTNQDDIQTLTGLAAGTTDLGTFTGTTITDNISIKPALQELETAIEGVGTPAASSVTNVAAGNIAATDVQGAINELDAEKLALAGGTMSGNLDMGANNLSNAGTITGTTLTDGTLSITTGNLTTTGTVDGRDVGTDGTNQDDIQTLTGAVAGTINFGATFTGTTIVDNGTVISALQDLETAVESTTDDQTAAEVANTAAGNIAATDVQGAINELDAEKLALAGGTMSGNLDMGANNLSNAGTITGTTLTDGTLSITTGNLTTTGTVDGRDVGTDGTNQDNIQTLTGAVAGTTNFGATFTGTTIVDNGTVISALQDLETAVESTTDDQTAAEVANTAAGNIAATDVQGAINELDAEKLALTGGTMSGNLDMGANNLSNAGTITGTTLTDGTLSITTGNLTTTGTVDGRDVGTDGTNQDDIQTLTGLAAGTTDLGTFTGTTITDNISIKPALQELETAIEGVGTPAASSVTNVAAGNIAATDVQGAINELDAEKLALAGGTMSGNLDMGANNLSNAGTITGTTLTDGTLSITTGNLTTTGTVDGRDVGTDGTNQDDIQTLTGAVAGTTNFGATFTGTTIVDNGTVISALQDLETAVESTTDDQTAAEVANTAAGNIAATDVQGAINELDAEKLALAGGTMSGNLDMGANNLSNAGTITGTTLTDGTLSITTGNLTTTGTVDGRDVGTDGTNQDDIQTLTGLAAGTTDLGTFTGTTITDNISIKPALQELETAVEGAAGLDLQAAYQNGGFITTDGGNGPFDVSGTETIGLSASGGGTFSVDGGDLDLLTSSTGDINVSPAGSLNLSSAGIATNVDGSLSVAEQTNLNASVNLGVSATDVINVNGDLNIFGDVLGASPLVFQGSTDNVNTTTIAITDPTGANTITFPDASGTVLLSGGLSNNLALSSDGTGQIVTADDAQPFTVNSNTINLGNGAGDLVVVAGSFNATSDNGGNLLTVNNTNAVAGNAASFTANGSTPAIQVNHGSPGQPGISSSNGVVIGNLTSDLAGAIRYTGTGFEGNIDGSPAGWQDMLNVTFPLSETQDNAGDLLNITNTNAGTGTAASFTSSGTSPAVSINHGSPGQPGLSTNNGVVIGNLTSDIAGAIRYTGTGFEGNTDGTPGGWEDLINVAFPLLETQDNAGDLLNITNTNVGTGTAASFTASGTSPAVFINHGSPGQPGLSTNNGVVIGNLTSDIAGAIRYTGTGFEGNTDGTPGGWEDLINVAFPLLETQDNAGDLLNITNTNVGTGTAASFSASGTSPAVFINHGSPGQPGLSTNNGVVIGNLTSDIAGAIRYTGTGFEGNTDGTPGGWEDLINVAFPLLETQDNAGDLLNITNTNVGTGTAASFTASGTSPAVFINHGSPGQPGLSTNNGVVIGNLTSDIAGAIRYTGTGFEGNTDGTPGGWQDMLNVTFPVTTTEDNAGLLLDITNTNATAGAAYITSNGTAPALQVEHTPGNQPSISANTGIVIGGLPTDIIGAIRFNGASFEGNTDGTPGGWQDMLNVTFPVTTTEDNAGLLLDITNTNATAGAAYITSNGTAPALQVEHTPGNQPSISANTGIVIGGLPTDIIGAIRFNGATFEGNIDGSPAGWIDLSSTLVNNPGTENLVAGFAAGSGLLAGGVNNTMIGENAGSGVTDGDDNVLIGRNAAIGITTGSNNVLIGSGTVANPAAQNTVAIGSGAQALADDAIAIGAGTVATDPNTMVLGDGTNTNYTVGIGVQNPQAPLQIGNNQALGHFENATETINGEFVGNNLYPDYTNVTDNDLRRLNADSSSFIFMEDGSMSFMRVASGAANSAVNLNGDIDSWIELNSDGYIAMTAGDAGAFADDGSDLDLEAGDAFGSGTGNGGNVFLRPGIDGGGGGVPGLIFADGDFVIQGDGGASRFLLLEDADGLEAVGLRVPDVMTNAYDLVLPDDQGTSGQVLSNDGSGNLSWVDNSSFAVPFSDNADNIIFGTATPALTIPSPDSQLGVGVDGGVAAQATLSVSSFQNRSQAVLLRSNGTQGAEIALNADEVIGDYGFVGWDGSAYNLQASMQGFSTQAWTGAQRGAGLSFEATPFGTGSQVEMMRLEDYRLSVIGVNGQAAIDALSYNAGLPSQFNMVTSNGTVGAPSPLNLGNDIGEILFVGNFNGVNNFTEGARINATTVENWGVGITGSQMRLGTTPSGTSGVVDQVLIDHDGNVSMLSTGALQVHNGTTGERPGSPSPGMIRYNTTLTQFEGFDGGWNPLGTSFLSANIDDGDNLVFGSSSGPAVSNTAPTYQLGAVAPGGRAVLSASSYSSASELRLSRANGTEGGPSLVNNFDILGEIAFTGRETGGAYPLGAAIRAEAIEDWTATFNVGTALSFSATPSGTGSPVEMMRLQDNIVELDGDIQLLDGLTRTIGVASNGTAAGNDLQIAAGSTTNAASAGGTLTLRSGDGNGANGGNIRLEPGNGTVRGGIDMRGVTRFGQTGALPGAIELEDNGGANAVQIRADGGSAAFTLTLPPAQGSAGQALINTDGAGALGWSNVIDGSGTTNDIPRFTAANTVGSSALADNGSTLSLTYNNTSTTGLMQVVQSNAGGDASIRFSRNGQLSVFGVDALDNAFKINVGSSVISDISHFEIAPSGVVSTSNDVNVGTGITLGATGDITTIGHMTSTISGPLNGAAIAPTSKITTLNAGPAINTINSVANGRELILIATAAVTINDIGTGSTNINLNGTSTSFTMAAGDTLHLVYDGANWLEVGRSVN